MKLYGAIDLHSTNNVMVVINEQDQVVCQKRLPNDLSLIAQQLSTYQASLKGIVVESTYNWYWLVDGLMEKGYRVHLANTAAIQQYNGLKYTDDHSDARWLAHLLRLGILPEGYIYPKQERMVRDLLRKRGQLVHQRTANLLSIQSLISRTTGNSISAQYIKALNIQRVDGVLPNPDLVLALKANQSGGHEQRGCPDRDPGESRPGPSQAVPSVQVSKDGTRNRAYPGADHHAGDRRDREICQCRQLCFVLSVCGE